MDETAAESCRHPEWTTERRLRLRQPDLLHPGVELIEYPLRFRIASFLLTRIPHDLPEIVQSEKLGICAVDQSGATILVPVSGFFRVEGVGVIAGPVSEQHQGQPGVLEVPQVINQFARRQRQHLEHLWNFEDHR